MRIIAFAEDGYKGSFLRAYQPLGALAERGHDVHVNRKDLHVNGNVRDFDAALISRYLGRDAEAFVKHLQSRGVAVVWDHDDAVELPPWLNTRALQVQQRTAIVRRMVRLPDVVTTTSQYIAARYREFGAASVHVVENYLGDDSANLQRVAPQRDGVLVGWAATLEHQGDWQQLGLREVFLRLLERHPALHVESIGPIDLGLPRDRYTRGQSVQFGAFGQCLTRFDVGLAPIVDHPFNRARSNIKAKQYAAAGVPWLASPIGPYVGLGEKQGGRLVPDDGWYEAVDELIRNGRLRRKLVKRGRRWAAQEVLVKHVGRWEAAFAEAVERARNRAVAVH